MDEGCLVIFSCLMSGSLLLEDEVVCGVIGLVLDESREQQILVVSLAARRCATSDACNV